MAEPITAMPLCRTRGCPEPANPDWHRPELWCGHATTQGMHQHVPKRGSGGHNPKSKVEAFLCESCTKKIDEGPWGNAMLDFPGVGRFWRIWDEHNNTVYQRLIAPREEAATTLRVESELLGDAGRDILNIDSERFYMQALVDPREEVMVSAPGEGPGELAVVTSTQAPAPQTGAMAPVLPTLADWERSATYDDAILALLSAQAHVRATGAYLWHCMAVARYQEAHRWAGDGWLVEARRLFGREATKLRDQAALFRRYLAWVEMAGEAQVENAAYISSPQLGVLERVTAEKFATSIESAINYVAETGDASARGLAGRLQEEGVLTRATTLYRCPSCGHVGPLSKFPKEEA